jgi:glycerol-1-phosphate dehydrogenase [NAD(P)+]
MALNPAFSLPHPLVIAEDSADRLSDFLRDSGRRPLLVCDERTRAAWPVEDALRASGIFEVLVLPGEPVADEAFVARVEAVLKPSHLPLALGSGTLTDIVRFAAFRGGLPWVSLPTAPSVDGFVSSVAAMTWGGAKISSPASPPAALFALPSVLAAAPQVLIAAGVGDILGKFTSVADWKLGALLFGEPYSDERASRTLDLAGRVLALAPAVGRGDREAVGRLMDALIESGLVMLEQGDSRPASGSEHHIAHVWEMKLIREGRSPVLHGAKVGVASVYAARFWKRLADTSSEQARVWTQAARAPLPEDDEAVIRAGFGTAAASLIESRRSFRPWTDETFRALLDTAVARWDEVRAIARAVPGPEVLEEALRVCGGPTAPAELGLEAELDEALRLGPYLRDRFTSARLLTLLGVDLASFR